MRQGIPLDDDDRWPWLQAVADWIGEVDVPTVVLVTMRDQVVATARQLRLAESIPGAEVIRVEGIEVTGERVMSQMKGASPYTYRVLRIRSSSVPNAIAALMLHHMRRGRAIIGTFRRGAGEVFNAGTADWAYGLDTEADVQAVTGNVLTLAGAWVTPLDTTSVTSWAPGSTGQVSNCSDGGGTCPCKPPMVAATFLAW